MGAEGAAVQWAFRGPGFRFAGGAALGVAGAERPCAAVELPAILLVCAVGGGVLVRAGVVWRMGAPVWWRRWTALVFGLIGVGASLLLAQDVVLVAAMITLPCYTASLLFAQAEIQRGHEEAAHW